MAGNLETPLFTPEGGGLGVLLSCTGVSSRGAIPSPSEGSVYAVTNLGTDNAFLAFGNSTVVATTSYMAFPPGVSYIGIPHAGSRTAAPTHIAGITTGATVAVQITNGSLSVV